MAQTVMHGDHVSPCMTVWAMSSKVQYFIMIFMVGGGYGVGVKFLMIFGHISRTQSL